MAGNKPSPDDLKTQYDKLSEDWRQLNSMLWQIPSAAVSIFSAIVVVAFQESLKLELEGWPRFIMLAVSSLFLFALTLEVLKKALYMNVISKRLKNLQNKVVKLKTYPKGYHDPEGIDFDPHPEEVEKLYDAINKNNRVYKWLHHRALKGREVLAWVIFSAAISAAFLAGMELLKILNGYLDN